MTDQVECGEHIIDCGAPSNPQPFGKMFTIAEHREMGEWKFDPTQVDFYLSDVQKNGRSLRGQQLREELADKPVLNANVLDYLLDHQELIPEGWKSYDRHNQHRLFFWGTLYADFKGRLYLRYLEWWMKDNTWTHGYHWVDDDWGTRRRFAAVLKA